MNLGIESQVFIVTGASSGLGRAVAETLAEEKARLIVTARRKERLEELEQKYPGRVTTIPGDIREDEVQHNILQTCKEMGVHGIFLNAGGPPAKRINETEIEDWDSAYGLLLRWKVKMVGKLLPFFEKQHYGRIIFSESSSVRQPVDHLVLSNSLRMAVAGYSKTLSKEYARVGITSNLIAPGYHDTSAAERLFKKRSELENTSFESAKKATILTIPAGKMGNPSDFATLAAWLMSPASGFVTGQVFTLDGGNVRSTL